MVLITKIKTEMTLIINIRTEMFLIIGIQKLLLKVCKIIRVWLIEPHRINLQLNVIGQFNHVNLSFCFGFSSIIVIILISGIQGSRDPRIQIQDPQIWKVGIQIQGSTGSRDPPGSPIPASNTLKTGYERPLIN